MAHLVEHFRICSCHFGISRKVFQPRTCRDGREHGGLNTESIRRFRRFTQMNLPKQICGAIQKQIGV
jgi:hypothetical protein